MQIAERTGIVVGVADASLSVASGEISVLMGCRVGQVNAVARGQWPEHGDTGQVLIGGSEATVDVAACDAARLRQVRRQRVAMVFQQFGLLPWRTVRENVDSDWSCAASLWRSAGASSMRSSPWWA